MWFAQSSSRDGIRPRTLFLAPLALFWLASPAVGEQEYATRYDAYAGYAFLDSPHIGLLDGFALQAGFRPKNLALVPL